MRASSTPPQPASRAKPSCAAKMSDPRSTRLRWRIFPSTLTTGRRVVAPLRVLWHLATPHDAAASLIRVTITGEWHAGTFRINDELEWSSPRHGNPDHSEHHPD